jgi:hypothetical protein
MNKIKKAVATFLKTGLCNVSATPMCEVGIEVQMLFRLISGFELLEICNINFNKLY